MPLSCSVSAPLADVSSPPDTSGTHESISGIHLAPESHTPEVSSSWPSQAFGSLQFQEGQPQAMVSSGLPTLGTGRDWQPPQDQLGRFIPQGMVRWGCLSNSTRLMNVLGLPGVPANINNDRVNS